MDNEKINVSDVTMNKYALRLLNAFLYVIIITFTYALFEVWRVGEYASEFFGILSYFISFCTGIFIGSILGSKLFGVNQKDVKEMAELSNKMMRETIDELGELDEEDKSKPFDKED